jgi:hypothetical protein
MKNKPQMSEQAVELFECIRLGEHQNVKKLVKNKDCNKNERECFLSFKGFYINEPKE